MFDGSKPNEFNVFGRDVDYGSSVTEVSAHWGGFSDYGTGIVEYQWAIGSCPECKDVINWHSVGLQTGMICVGVIKMFIKLPQLYFG